MKALARWAHELGIVAAQGVFLAFLIGGALLLIALPIVSLLGGS